MAGARKEARDLIARYSRLPKGAHTRKIEAIHGLEKHPSPEVLGFFLGRVADANELPFVRLELTQALTVYPGGSGTQRRIARTMLELSLHDSDLDVRIYAAMALEFQGQFGFVRDAMAQLAVEQELDDRLRAAAFEVIERAGGYPVCVRTMEALVNDEVYGTLARRALRKWKMLSTRRRQEKVSS